MNVPNENVRVTMLHRINRLKIKAGADLNDNRSGFIDPKAIEKAQAAIDAQGENYFDEVRIVIAKLDDTWESLKLEPDEEKRRQLLNRLYNYSNNIKDMAKTFDYELMGHFGASLQNFCEKINIANNAHGTIVQAHIDVMWVAFQANIKDYGGDQAEELREILAKAIKEHS